MKRIILPVLFSCLVSLSFGQSLKKANKYLDNKEFEKAKTEVDAYLEKNPKDAEGLYLKSKLYAKIADSADLHNLVNGNAREAAFEAFKQAYADSTNMKARLSIMKDNFQPIFDMYGGYYNDAVKDFTEAAQSQSKEKFEDAMNNFIKANEVGSYIGENEWAKIGKVDTTLVLNIGKAAINAKNDEVAIKYFKELADNKITGPSGQKDEDFKLPYEWLELHFKEAGDVDNMLKYAKLGNELYPQEAYFNFVLMDYYRDQKDLPKVLDLWKEVVTANPDSLNYKARFANDIFGYIYNSDEGTELKDKDQWLSVLKGQLENALQQDPDNVSANWLYAQYLYNQGIEARDMVSKTTDAAKKADLKKQSIDYWNKAVPYADKAISQLDQLGKKSDRSRYKSVVNLMQNIYQSLENKEKLKQYQDLYDAADKKFETRD